MKKTVFLLLLLTGLLVPWATQAQTTQHLDLYENETVLCDAAPIYCMDFFNWNRSQTVFPASDLQEMVGGTITQIKFYTAPIAVPHNIHGYNLSYVYLTEVESSNISEFISMSSLPTGNRLRIPIDSYNFQVVDGVGEVTINLGTGYEYHGGNLLFDCENRITDISFISPHIFFYGKNAPGASVSGNISRAYSSSSIVPIQRNFLPRTTFTYTAIPPSCPKPTHLAVDYTSESGTTAIVSWTGNGATLWQICLNDDLTNLVTATTNSYTISDLTTDQHYSVKVRAVCDNAYSLWTESVSFIPSSHIAIGSGTASYGYLPTTSSRTYSLTAQLYNIDELGTAGVIQTIDFYKVGTTECSRNLDIYMVSTSSLSYLPSTSLTNHINISPDDLVFSGMVNFASNAWTSITLDNPFEYNGINNVFIVVHDNTVTHGTEDIEFLSYIGGAIFQDGNHTSQNYSYEPTDPPYYQSIYYTNNTINYNPVVEFSGNYGYNYDDPELSSHWFPKNQIRITKSDAPSCFKPIELIVYDISAVQATIEWYDPNEADSWEVQYSTSNDFTTDVHTVNVTNNPYTITGLTGGNTTYHVRVRTVCGDNNSSWWSSSISFNTDLCQSEDMCSIYCELYDNGYGWNEAAINIYDDASDIFLYSLTCYGGGGDAWKSGNNLSTTNELAVCPSRPIRFEWQSGYGNDEDLSYILYDLNNAEVYSGTGDDIDGFIYTTSCIESDCDVPDELTVSTSGTNATVEWDGLADATYNIYLNGVLYDNVVTSPYTIENLDMATTYMVKLESTCGSDPSNWTRPVSFTTDLCLPEDQCTISYELHDENGCRMEWNSIKVLDAATGIYIDTWPNDEWEQDEENYNYYFWARGSSSVCDGRELRFEWNGYYSPSDYPWSFVVLDVNGERTEISLNDVYNGTATYMVDCFVTNCHKPTNFVVTYEGGNTATATWDMVSDVTYNISVNGTTVNNVSSPYTISNLSLATVYEVKLQANCGDEVSQWVRKTFNTDCCSQEEMCEIRYELSDRCPDTWNGNAIQVVDVATGIILDTWTIADNGSSSGSSEPTKSGDEEEDGTDGYSFARGTLRVCNGREIKFTWVLGGWPEECVYTVYDVTGEVLFSGEGAMNEDVLYTVNCNGGGIPINANSWYAISAPKHDEEVASSLSIGNVDGLVPTETGVAYDLFRYNEAAAKWENQKESTTTGSLAAGFNTLDCGRGYIYRSSASTVLTFDGNPYTGELSEVQSLTSSCSDADLKGFNLIGNPYQHSIYKGEDFDEDELLDAGYYSLNRDGSWLAHLDSDPIKVGQGVLVRVSGDNSVNLTFYDSEEASTEPTKKNSTDRSLQFTVTGGDHKDVAFALYADREGLPKFGHLNAEAPSLSIPQGGTDYAIATINGSTQSFPLRFRSIVEDDYTLVVKAVSDFDYLHLIDKVAGRDIDLLRQPTYTFTHTGNQTVANRFMVKLSPEGESTDDIFAYQNGDRIVVEGTGTLQVYDVLGRQLFTHEINSQFSILNSQFPNTGVYILRLNGKSQKLVIK